MDEEGDCCCFLFTRRLHQQRRPGRGGRRGRRADARSRSHLAAGRAPGAANRQSYPQAARQQLSYTASIYSASEQLGRRLQCEEIELQCWSLSPDRLLVNSDKRCRLINRPQGQTRARPLDGLEEGRRHLDVRRPESMSLIKFKIDHQSGQVERRLSIHEVSERDNEFLDLLGRQTPEAQGCREIASDGEQQQQQRRLKLAEKLSSRSFLVIERESVTAASGELEQTLVSLHNSSASESERLCEKINENNRRPPGGAAEQTDLERELISSISIETQPQPDLEYEPAPAPTQTSTQAPDSKPPGKRKRKKLRLNIARRIYRLISSTTSGHSPSPLSSHQEHSTQVSYSALAASFCEQEADENEGDEEEEARLAGRDFIGASYQRVEFDAHGVPQMLEQEPSTPPGADCGQLVPLARPDSIYLWPERPEPTDHSFMSSSRFNRRQSQHICMISYNHSEAKEYAVALHARLKQLGIGAYLDLYDIRRGEDWQDSLNFAILNCAVFIPLVTPSYGETLWTSRECKLADVLAKRIIPINFGQKWPPPSLAIQFATLQYIDWLHLDADSLAALEPQQRAHQRPAHGAERRLLSQSHFLLGQAHWPAECALSCAAQLKRSLEFEFEAYLQHDQYQRAPIVELQESVATAAPASWSAAGSGRLVASSRALKPPSPHSDSGYESPPQKQKQAPAGAIGESDAILNTSIQSNQSGSSLGRKLRSLARPAKKSSESSSGSHSNGCPARSYGATEHNESGTGSSDEPNSAEVFCGAPELNGFKLTRQRLKPAAPSEQPQQQQQCDSGHYSVIGSSVEHEIAACEQARGPAESRKQVQLQQKQQQKQQEEAKRARKSSLGHKAKKVLSRVRRSMNSPKAHS